MSTRSNVAKEICKFNYRHPIRPKRLGSTRILQSTGPSLDGQLPVAGPQLAGGRKRCRGAFEKDFLEPAVIGRQSLKLKSSTLRYASLMPNGRRRPSQSSRTKGKTRIDIDVCNDINCAAKRQRSIDNSCLPTDSYTNAEQLQSALRTQNHQKDTPLMTALRNHHFDRLEEYLRGLETSDAEARTNSLKEILTIKNEAYDTCLTLAAKGFYSKDLDSSGNPTSRLAPAVPILLKYCSLFPEIVMIRTVYGLTAVHHLLEHVPAALKKNDESFFTMAESMIKLCPDVLTLKSTKGDDYLFEESPFEKLNRMLAGVVEEVLIDSAGAVALRQFSDCVKYLCIKQGYDLGVLYKVGEGQSES